MTYMIESKELSKTYVIGKKNEQHVLKRVSLNIQKGDSYRSWALRVQGNRRYCTMLAAWTDRQAGA